MTSGKSRQDVQALPHRSTTGAAVSARSDAIT
jgi:hypothetical protein